MTGALGDLRIGVIARRCGFAFGVVIANVFLADAPKLAEFYEPGFQQSALPRNSNVEEIPKKDVKAALAKATRKCAKKRYHKTQHAPELLKLIRLAEVRKVAPQCHALCEKLENLIG